MSLRGYEVERDGRAVFELYQACFGETWPLRAEAFHAIISEYKHYRAGDHAVVEKDGAIVGFVAAQQRRDDHGTASTGGIALLMVHPAWRRQGIGRRLHDWALRRLCEANLQRVQLANVSGRRLWQGVPGNLPAARAFFERCGWREVETSDDLVGDVSQLRTFSQAIEQRPLPNLEIRLATPADASALLDFEGRAFPNWHSAFTKQVELGQFENILVARTKNGNVVGSLILSDWQSAASAMDFLWQIKLGERLGALACVGVVERQNNRGIGSALCARGADILRDRGVDRIHISWTGRPRFYERLGYRLWQTSPHGSSTVVVNAP